MEKRASTPESRRTPNSRPERVPTPVRRDLLAGLKSTRAALVVFVLVEGASGVLFLRVARYAWFSQDEWDFLADRSATSLRDLFRPKNEHWTTLPVLLFRLLWWLVGLRSYVPYLVPLILVHLAVAALLRAVLRRADVNAWLATGAASAFALFGSGWFNLEYAFQITFLGSVACGLIHLLLSDHAGGVDRRDALGLLAAVAGLMCSGVALTMIAVVGVATLVRRGWRIALLHSAPLGVVYLTWFVAIGHQGSRHLTSISDALRFTAREIPSTFGALGQLPGVGFLLAVLLIVGVVATCLTSPGPGRRSRVALVLAFCTGAFVFEFLNGLSRIEFAASTPPGPESRYQYIVAALLLPVIAIAADATRRRWRAFGPVLLALLVIGIPGNVRTLFNHAPDMRTDKQLILSSADLSISHALPRTIRPDAFSAPWVTVGWLLDGVASGRVPNADPMAPSYAGARIVELALQPTNRSQPRRCQQLVHKVVRVVARGEVLADPRGRVSVTYEPFGAAASAVRTLRKGTVVAVVGPLRLGFAPSPGGGEAILCTQSAGR